MRGGGAIVDAVIAIAEFPIVGQGITVGIGGGGTEADRLPGAGAG